MTEAYIKDVVGCLKVRLKSVKYNLAQNIISDKTPISLKSIALNKIIVTVWQKDDSWNKKSQHLPSIYSIYSSYLPFESPPVNNRWKFSEKRVLQKLLALDISRYDENLEEKVKKIGVQLVRFLFLMNFPRELSSKIKTYYFDHICWTYQGTINNSKTALSLVENTDLSISEKYILSCFYCLETKIKELYKKLPKDFIQLVFELFESVNEYSFNILQTRYQFRLVAYWTYTLKANEEKCCKIGHKWVLDNYDILEWAIKTYNEAAIYYIWNRLLDKKIEKYLIKGMENCSFWLKFDFEKGFFMEIHFYNILYYLISQLSDTQFERVCDKKIYKLIGQFLDNWIIHDAILSTAKYALQYIKLMNKEDALKILFDWNESAFEKGQRQKLFSEVKVGDKPKFMNEMTSFHEKGMRQCEILLSKGRIYIFKSFLLGMSTNEKEFNEYKANFLKTGEYSLQGMIFCGGYEEANKFLELFCPKGNINQFKSEFAYKYGDCFEIHWKKNILYKFLNWCFDGNEEKINCYANDRSSRSVPRNLRSFFL